MLRAHQLMNRAVSTVSPNMTLGDLAAFLVEENVQGAPVVDDEGRLCGVVSTRDLVSAITDREEPGNEPMYGVVKDSGEWLPLASYLASPDFGRRDSLVSEVMTPDPVTAAETTTAGELAKLMMEEGIHRVLITQGSELSGIVSATDLLQALVQYESDVAQEV